VKVQIQEAAVDQSKLQHLVGLFGKYGEAGKGVADEKLYAYMDYIEKRVVNKMPSEMANAVMCDAWNSIDWEHDDEMLPLPEDQIPIEDIPELVRAANPRLPAAATAELARRVQRSAICSAKSRPIYDEIIEFLGLTWAFQYRQPGCAADPIDEQFLDTLGYGDAEASIVVDDDEDPLYSIDDTLAVGPITTGVAGELMALAQAVNAARTEYRSARNECAVFTGDRPVEFPADTWLVPADLQVVREVVSTRKSKGGTKCQKNRNDQ
jgi:hypothetical protein